MSWVNEAGWDRALRLLLGVILLFLGWVEAWPPPWATVSIIFGWVPLITGLVGWCPVYAVFRFRTKKPFRRSDETLPPEKKVARVRDSD